MAPEIAPTAPIHWNTDDKRKEKNGENGLRGGDKLEGMSDNKEMYRDECQGFVT